MSLFFLLLPVDIIAKCFADYLDIHDISAIDIACCNTLDRPAFIDAINWKHAVFRGISSQSLSDSYVIWLILRNVSVMNLGFDELSFSCRVNEILRFIDKRIFSRTFTLTIDCTIITEDIILLIPDLFPNLQNLHLENIKGKTSKATLESILLSTTNTLTDLTIRSCSDRLLDSRFIGALKQCAKLQRLEISSISSEFATYGQFLFWSLIESCSGLPLQYLNIRLNGDLINQLVITSIAQNLHSLISLDISHNNIDDNGIILLPCALPYLESLDLDNSGITGVSWIKMASSCRRLTHLSLCKCDRLSSSTFVSTPTNSFPSLTSLNLTGIPSLTDAAVVHLAECCKFLKQFEIGGRDSLISDIGIIGVVSKCNDRLEMFSIEGSKLVTDTSIRSISTSCPNLNTFYCDNCSIMDFSSFELLGKGCTLLRNLSIGGQVWIDSKSIDKLTASFPRLERLVIDTEANYDLISRGGDIIQLGQQKDIQILLFLSQQTGYTVFTE